MLTTTLGSLKTLVRNRTEEYADTSGSGYISDSELTSYINLSLANLIDEISMKAPMRLIERTNLSITAGNRETALPTGSYKVVGVAMVDSSSPSGYTKLDAFQWEERYDDYTYYNGIQDTRYMIVNDQIELLPIPASSMTLRIEYIPHFTRLTSDSDTVEIGSGFDDYISCDTAIKILLKSDPNAAIIKLWMTEREYALKRIMGMFKQDASPKRIVDKNRRTRRIY